MRFGILLCDDYYPEAVEKYGQYDDAFKRILPIAENWQWVTYRCHLGEFPVSPLECDAWLVSGSKWSAYEDEPWIAKLASLIQDIENKKYPLIGVCFGHQVIHHALGGKVAKSDAGWGLGPYSIEVAATFINLKQGQVLKLIAMHQDQVEYLAPGFSTIAGSTFCPHAITRKNNHILTIQAHPEFEPEFFIQLCERIKNRAGTDIVETAELAIRAHGSGDQHNAIELITEFYQTSCFPK